MSHEGRSKLMEVLESINRMLNTFSEGSVRVSRRFDELTRSDPPGNYEHFPHRLRETSHETVLLAADLVKIGVEIARAADIAELLDSPRNEA